MFTDYFWYACGMHSHWCATRCAVRRVVPRCGALPKSRSFVIFEDWRLLARLSFLLYSFTASFSFAQSVILLVLCILCFKSIPCMEKICKQSLCVHSKPTWQDELGNALLIFNETINIPSNRNSCNGVKGRRLQMHHSKRFLKLSNNFVWVEECKESDTLTSGYLIWIGCDN